MRIVAVSYLNTLPFIYGLKNSGKLNDFDLQLEVPSLCSERLLKNEADIVLTPVVSALDNPLFEITSDYCIGAQGKVDSVLLLSRKPISEIDKIYLDFDSKTSVLLAKVLAKKFWHISPQWLPYNPAIPVESVVLIGDKTFQEKEKYPYSYDLGEEWFKYVRLPFVFACWVIRKDIPADYRIQLNAALKYGVEHIRDMVNNIEGVTLSKEELLYYYQHSISYDLNNAKRAGMNLFLEEIRQI